MFVIFLVIVVVVIMIGFIKIVWLVVEFWWFLKLWFEDDVYSWLLMSLLGFIVRYIE